ncbi:hypothetical protein EIN_430790 [Entamoeba invadens IP1]|uniref:MIF4G domain-containing protein n=1 Tax=Entamoeba invadens IP1 TaxID=370355 RepID=A0A0A1UFI4_ENTIV|nr:hypothetical protein EIN_430790 [Entamoeba invadens IP1]ELP95273.1 hypothetical protein EIN_430790 [Entamoeba invadens IP1]|eukprot:XP_004262044.1 hypothetical protein EIN_430790 [Entamoeba invadens IP1]
MTDSATTIIPSKSAQPTCFKIDAKPFVFRKKTTEKIEAPKPVKLFSGLPEDREQTPTTPEFTLPKVAVSADLPHLHTKGTKTVLAEKTPLNFNFLDSVKKNAVFVPRKKQKTPEPVKETEKVENKEEQERLIKENLLKSFYSPPGSESKRKRDDNVFRPATHISQGEPAPKEDIPITSTSNKTTSNDVELFRPATRISAGESAPKDDDKKYEEDDNDRIGVDLPITVKSATPQVPQWIYSIEELKDFRANTIRARDSIYEAFKKFTIKKKKETKLINVDQSKAMYRQWFNKLTEITIDKVASEMVLQMRTREDVETMLSILFKNAINERRYVHLYVKFFVKVRTAMAQVEAKKDLAADMTAFLLTKAENQFSHPPIPRKEVEGESVYDKQEREDLNAVDEFEYLGTVFLVSYLYTEGTVIAELVLQCLNILSKLGGRTPTKAFTTLVKETCDKLVSEQVDMTNVITTIQKMQKIEGISKFEEIVLENAKDQIQKAVKLLQSKTKSSDIKKIAVKDVEPTEIK